MGKLKLTKCEIEGVYVIEPLIHRDERGYFVETYNKKDLEELGLNMEFVQDNQSMSTKGILRGLHFQKTHPQGKLVRALSGRVFDVAVDIRKESKTFGKWFGVELSDENMKQLYIPEGLAHGYLVLSQSAVFAYKCTEYYVPGDDGGVYYDDPDIGIEWPISEGEEIQTIERDRNWPRLRDL